jgi:hypothetical protein
MSPARAFLAGCLTSALVFAGLLTLTGAASRHATFDEITVGRINIQEPDGTKRLVISNRAQFPGAFEGGKEVARPDRREYAGMLFVDESGNENGGLIQKGSMKGSAPDAGLSLTFDRYRQDQALQLLHKSDARASTSSIYINDVPDHTVTPMSEVRSWQEQTAKLSADERKVFYARLAADGKLSQNRITLGTTGGRSSILGLKDANGKTRMRLSVSAEGKAEIEMLDENGKVLKSITPGS